MITPAYQQINTETLHEILNKTMPDVMDLMRQFREELGGQLPQEMSYGMIAGYLRGRGYSWEESLVSMNRFIQIQQTHYSHASEKMHGTMSISGKENSVKFEFKKTSQ